MSAISYKNFAYIRGPKGDPGVKGERGPKGDPGDIGSLIITGRIEYDAANKTLGFNETGLLTDESLNSKTIDGGSF